MKRTDGGNTALMVGLFGAVATICAAMIGAGATILGPAIARMQEARATPTVLASPTPPPTENVSWVPGSENPNHPHVVASSTAGDWVPAPGYAWANSEPGDLAVVWKAGLSDPDHPNILSSETEGEWNPASGYKWVNPDDPEDLEVVPIQGTIEDVTVEHNVQEGGQTGMRIHVKFSVDNLKAILCNVGAYFYYSNGTIFAGRPGDSVHMASGGQLAATSDFTPAYDQTEFQDYVLFLPYDAINVDAGIPSVDMKFQVRLYNWRDNSFITESDYIPFTYSH